MADLFPTGIVANLISELQYPEILQTNPTTHSEFLKNLPFKSEKDSSMQLSESLLEWPAIDVVNVKRIDGRERVGGISRYCTDWKLPRMLYARIIMSSIPHGIVRNIDTIQAHQKNGVRAIVTCKTDHTLWNAGEREHKRRLFTEEAKFVGDCIGAVAADSRFIAQEAVDLVRVEYDELPAVFDIDEALKPTSPKVWNDGNTIGPLRYGFGDAGPFFERDGSTDEANLMLEADYSTSRVHNSPLEPAASLAWWEGDRLTVVAATQGISMCREGIAEDLGIPLEHVRVICQYKGGGFGNKNNSMNYDIIAAILSKQTKRPVMVEYSRGDDFIGVHGRWSSRQHLRGAIGSEDGKLLALDVRAFCDIGAYTRHVKMGNFVNGAEDHYSCKAWRAEVYGVYTNTPATAHMRAPTGPQSCFASETFLDEVAFRLRIDPVEIRLRNAIQRHHGKDEFTSNHLKDCVTVGADVFGWKQKWRLPPEKGMISGSQKKLVGMGVAMTSWHSRLGKGEAVVRLNSDGSVEVFVGVVDIGTGAKTTMALIAAEALGVSVESVKVVWGDTSTCPYSVGESGSRTTSFTGQAVNEAAFKVRQKLIDLACYQTGMGREKLELKNSQVLDSDRHIQIQLKDLLIKAGLSEISERAITEPRLPKDKERFAFAAHYAEVEIDSDTGEISVRRYVAVHESGKIINGLTARSQVQGGVVMGLGMALSEKILIDPHYGSIQNPSFYNYRLPNITSVPPIKVVFVDSEDPFGPKSLGEIPVVPVPAAVGNAIFNATGVRLRDLPFSREKLVEMVSKSRGN